MIHLDEVLVNWTKIFTKAYEIESLEAYHRTASRNNDSDAIWWGKE